VIDFTKATDDEIIAFISRKLENGCGRFRSSQLKNYSLPVPVTIRPGFTLLKAGVISLLLLLVSKQVSAQTVSVKPVTENIQQPLQSADKSTLTSEIVIRGIVIDVDAKLPMPGVNVVQKGTINRTQTDGDGKYELKIKHEAGRVLVFSFIGMITEEISLPNAIAPNVDVAMSADITGLMGEIVITGEIGSDRVYTEPKSRLEKFVGTLKNLF